MSRISGILGKIGSRIGNLGEERPEEVRYVRRCAVCGRRIVLLRLFDLYWGLTPVILGYTPLRMILSRAQGCSRAAQGYRTFRTIRFLFLQLDNPSIAR